ncbi:6-phosphogluconolactonase [Novosphingobium endophyticum]|uniref:6-phosphogluconolactonase n=1 Tax=Novosphingobium endophyticum TaxID=1955250 RepID=A0A916TTM9_9SPHN|nr:6-phosphogluconolactonase [Novosphingobium endophyticum]GGC05478.1 6-phosphogluconolactonase [Novosphingobium endophyticum]
MSKVEIIEGSNDKAIAEWVAQRLKAALATTPDDIAVTVPGGSTPFPIFDRLAKMPLPWHRIAIWPGDDRLVEEDHAASNVGKIRARLEPAGARIVPLAEDAQPPRFALAWLGMGADGHVASLFPNTDPRPDDRRAVRRLTPDPLPPEAPFDRVSLTIPALVDSDEIMFVIRGADKRAIFDAALKGGHDLPVARLLRAARHKVTCFC